MSRLNSSPPLPMAVNERCMGYLFTCKTQSKCACCSPRGEQHEVLGKSKNGPAGDGSDHQALMGSSMHRVAHSADALQQEGRGKVAGTPVSVFLPAHQCWPVDVDAHLDRRATWVMCVIR